MSSLPHNFKRLIIGLQTSRPEQSARLGVEFANLLQLDLLGLFVEDANLRQLEHLPFVRELRSLGGGWQTLEPERLSRELELAAGRTERLFTDAARLLAGKHKFEIIRGTIKGTIASISRGDDIIMLAEPSGLGEHAGQQPSSFGQAALETARSVLFAPRHPARTAGAVATIARSVGDPIVETAAAIAAAAGEELTIIFIGQDTRTAELRKGSEVHYTAIDARALGDPRLLAPALGRTRERLLVAERGVIADDVARSVSSLGGLAVLLIQPADAPTSA